MGRASKERIHWKEVFQPKHVNGMSRSEILRRKFHALFGGRCLEVSCVSLLVTLRFVPVCIPHTALLIVELLSVCVCTAVILAEDATHRWWHRTSPVVSQDFKQRFGDSNAAHGRDRINRSAAVSTPQIRRHCRVVMWSPCRLKSYEDSIPGPLI